MSGSIPDGPILINENDMRKRIMRAQDYLWNTYAKDNNFIRIVPLVAEDLEQLLNDLQAYIQYIVYAQLHAQYNAQIEDEIHQAVIMLQHATQAIFLLGYDTAIQHAKQNESIPNVFKQL